MQSGREARFHPGRAARIIILVLLSLGAVAVGVRTASRHDAPDRSQESGQPAGTQSPSGEPQSGESHSVPPLGTLRSTELPGVAGEEVRRAALGPRGLVVQGTDAGRVRIFGKGNDQPRNEFLTDGSAIAALDISDDETTVAAATHGRSLWVWKLVSGDVYTIRNTPEWSVIALNANGERLAAAEFVVAIYDVRAQRLVMTVEPPPRDEGRGTYNDVAFSTDMKVVAAVSNEGADSWDLSTGNRAWPVMECSCDARQSALSSGARFAVFGTADGHVLLWDLVTGCETVDRTISAKSHTVSGAAVTATGHLVFAATGYGDVVIWHSGSRQAVGEMAFTVAGEGFIDRAWLTDDGTRALVSAQVNSLAPGPGSSEGRDYTPCRVHYTGCAVHHRFFLLSS